MLCAAFLASSSYLNTAFCGPSLRRAPTRYRSLTGTAPPLSRDVNCDGEAACGSSTVSRVFLVLRIVLHPPRPPRLPSPWRSPPGPAGSEPPERCSEKGSLSSPVKALEKESLRRPPRPPGDQVALCPAFGRPWLAAVGFGGPVPVDRRFLLGLVPPRPSSPSPEEALAFPALAVSLSLLRGSHALSCRMYSVSWEGFRVGG